jgi:hypothetical protein
MDSQVAQLQQQLFILQQQHQQPVQHPFKPYSHPSTF